MYRYSARRYKRKDLALAGLYTIFLLATVGEFFYALDSHENRQLKLDRIERKEEGIPIHLPEESKVDFVRLLKLKGRYAEDE